MHFHDGLGAVQDLVAHLGEGHVAPAGDHIVRQARNLLLVGLVRYLRSAQHHDNLRRHALQHAHHFVGLFDVPYIDAETDDARLVRQDALHDLRGLGADHELLDPGLLLQLPHVRKQVAQAQGSMGVARIEGREQDGHGNR
ncbi:hypothetical protein D3C86_1787170 [compost metagenome]